MTFNPGGVIEYQDGIIQCFDDRANSSGRDTRLPDCNKAGRLGLAARKGEHLIA
jgi:hypothetical protein